jgi:hypothetical protein
MEKTVLISMPVGELQTLIINCVQAGIARSQAPVTPVPTPKESKQS